MKKFLILAFLIYAFSASAQEEETVRRLDPNVFFGGNLGASIGTVTVIDVSPYVGYRFFDQQLGLGIGGTFQYFADDRYNYETTVYGGRLFAQILPKRLSNIILHAEMETLNYENYVDKRRIWVLSPLAGGGIRMGNVSMIMLWNLNGHSEIHSNPMMRIGYTF